MESKRSSDTNWMFIINLHSGSVGCSSLFSTLPEEMIQFDDHIFQSLRSKPWMVPQKSQR